jgi:hypothetical protein
MREPAIILGISPGTKHIGIAVFSHGSLIEWQIKVFYGAWNEDKLNRICAVFWKLCNRYKPDCIALKVTSHLHIEELVNGFSILASRSNIPIYQYTLEEVKEAYTPQEPLRDAIVDCIVHKYPVLEQVYAKEERNYNSYYLKIFEAVAVADMSYK